MDKARLEELHAQIGQLRAQLSALEAEEQRAREREMHEAIDRLSPDAPELGIRTGLRAFTDAALEEVSELVTRLRALLHRDDHDYDGEPHP